MSNEFHAKALILISQGPIQAKATQKGHNLLYSYKVCACIHL